MPSSEKPHSPEETVEFKSGRGGELPFIIREVRRLEAQHQGKPVPHTEIREGGETEGDAARRFIEKMSHIDAELREIEAGLERAKKKPLDYPAVRDHLLSVREEVENLYKDPNLAQEVKDKFSANMENAKARFLDLDKRSDIEIHEERIGRVMADILLLKNILVFKGKKGVEMGDRPEALDIIRDELMRQSTKLLDIDKEMLVPVTQERHEADVQVAEVWVDVENRQRAMGATGKKDAASAAWMPRIPEPPYIATLTAAPVAPPPSREPMLPPEFTLPENWDDLDEGGRIAALENMLEQFKSFHDGIVKEHRELIARLTEQVKDRKLDALRASLDS